MSKAGHSHSARIGYRVESNCYDLWVFAHEAGDDRKRSVFTETGFEDVEMGCYVPATAHLTKPQVEQLMTQLWAAGIRPDGWGHEGQVAALKDHLQDMRTLVFEPKPSTP